MSPVRTTILSFLHVVLSYGHGPAARVIPAVMRTIGGAADQTASPPYESRVAATLSPGCVDSPAPAGCAAGLRMVSVSRQGCPRVLGFYKPPCGGFFFVTNCAHLSVRAEGKPFGLVPGRKTTLPAQRGFKPKGLFVTRVDRSHAREQHSRLRLDMGKREEQAHASRRATRCKSVMARGG
jgi:hypothetical protein